MEKKYRPGSLSFKVGKTAVNGSLSFFYFNIFFCFFFFCFCIFFRECFKCLSLVLIDYNNYVFIQKKSLLFLFIRMVYKILVSSTNCKLDFFLKKLSKKTFGVKTRHPFLCFFLCDERTLSFIKSEYIKKITKKKNLKQR